MIPGETANPGGNRGSGDAAELGVGESPGGIVPSVGGDCQPAPGAREAAPGTVGNDAGVGTRLSNSGFPVVTLEPLVGIDRLSFTVKLTPAESQEFASFAQSSVAFGERRNSRTPTYRYSWMVLDGITVEYGDRASGQNNPHLRIDYNPAKHSLHAVDGFSRFLGRFWNITRIDIAVDYAHDLGEGLIRHDTLRKGATFVGQDGRLETVYLGSQHSDRFFRVYDKRRERSADGESIPGTEPWWRVEVEWRCSGRDPLRPDLFEGVQISIAHDIDNLAWSTRTILKQLLANPAHLQEAPKATKKRYRDLLNKHTQPLTPSPHAAYLAARGRLQADLDELRILARGGVMLDAQEERQGLEEAQVQEVEELEAALRAAGILVS